MEQWLRTVGLARYDAYHCRAERGRPMAVVFARLRARAGKTMARRDDNADEMIE